jgi:Ca-activated chloride channel homolog
VLEFVSLSPLAWLLAIAVVLVVGWRFSLVDRPALSRWGSLVLRAAAILLLILALCRPFAPQKNDRVHANFLLDVSESIDLDGAIGAVDKIDGWIKSLRPGDTWSLFAVGNGVRQFSSTDDLRTLLNEWKSGVSDDRFRSQTQLVDAMLATRMVFPADKARRIVLLTDGQETEREIAPALKQLGEEGIDVRLAPIAGLAHAEAATISLEPSSTESFYGEMLRMTVKLAANQPMGAKLRLIHNGVAVQQKDLRLDPAQQNVAQFDAEMTTPGASTWSAELVPDDDHFPINNVVTCTINVRGRPRVLVLHQKPQVLRAFARMLEEQDMTVEVRGRYGLPETLEEMASFDAIVLADLPATSLTVRQMQMVKRYVTDLGGGLVMMGSENSFGLGGYYKTPVEEVLPLISRFEKEKEKPSLAMVLVIDKSGSMEGLKIEAARQAAKAAVELLSARDSIAVVAFDQDTQVVCEMTSASNVSEVQAAIDTLMAGGGTFMYPAMVKGKEMLEATSAKIRHMICMTDGITPPAEHEALAEELASEGITVSTVALGEDADRQLLSSIAEAGHGRFYETNDPSNVPQIFTKETMEATKSAIKEDLYGTVQVGDHPILAGYHGSDLPFTLGYVMTEAKPTAQLLLAVETGDPLLAVGRYGLGTGMAYTSDLSEKWGGEWLAWSGCGKFWAQAIRGVLRKSNTAGLHVATRATESDWLFDIRRTGPDAAPLNGVHWNAGALDENGREEPVAVREMGLGRYEASVPIVGRQQLAVRLQDTDHDATSVQYLNRPYPAEYRLARDMPADIAALPRAEPHSIVADIRPQITRRSVAQYTYFAALAALLASVLLRRI